MPKRVKKKPVKAPLADGLYWAIEAGGIYWTDGPFRGPLVQVVDPSEEDDLDADVVLDSELAADSRTSQAAGWRRRLY